MSVPQTEVAVAGLPVLRLLAAPPSEPPYDDDAAGGAFPTESPRLRLVPRPAAPAGRPTRPARRISTLLHDEPVVRTPTADLPPSGPFARALVQRLVEVRAGVRPLRQLQRDTTPTLYAELEQHLRRRLTTLGLRPGARNVLSVHVQDRPDGVAEVCATVRHGERAGALALRLEGVHGRWTCTLLLGL